MKRGQDPKIVVQHIGVVRCMATCVKEMSKFAQMQYKRGRISGVSLDGRSCLVRAACARCLVGHGMLRTRPKQMSWRIHHRGARGDPTYQIWWCICRLLRAISQFVLKQHHNWGGFLGVLPSLYILFDWSCLYGSHGHRIHKQVPWHTYHQGDPTYWTWWSICRILHNMPQCV